MLPHLLELRGVPYLFATGYLPVETMVSPGVMVLRKPFSAADLLAAVETLLTGKVEQRVKALC